MKRKKHFKRRKRRKLKYYFTKRRRRSLRLKIKHWLQYFKVRYMIGTMQRYLAVMTLFSVATVAVTIVERFKGNIEIFVVCATGMFYYFLLYVKERKFYSKYQSYNYYEVKSSTGTVHMRIIDLYRRFAGKTNEEIKSLLIENSYHDFIDIFKDYKELNFGSRAIQTHKTLVRPFMKALRDNELVAYEDLDLERFLNETTECDGIDLEECFFSILNGYRVQLRYIGCVQNKILALRYPIAKCSKNHFRKFSTSVPYFEVTVMKC